MKILKGVVIWPRRSGTAVGSPIAVVVSSDTKALCFYRSQDAFYAKCASFQDTSKLIHETLSLAKRQMKNMANNQGGYYRHTRIFTKSTTGSCLDWVQLS
jgi:hypothetical protein